MYRHTASWIDEARLGSVIPPYIRTWEFARPYIDARHAALASARTDGAVIDIGIPGWLRPQDALKLYELACFASGDVLEIGTYRGLSASIQASAMAPGRRLVTMELNPDNAAEAIRRTAQWADRIDVAVGDARASCADLIAAGRRFGFAFVDHSHEYDLVLAACRDVKRLLAPGAFCLFHDYNDSRNGRNPDYGVWQAVRDGFADGAAAFWGVYGCAGLWRLA